MKILSNCKLVLIAVLSFGAVFLNSSQVYATGTDQPPVFQARDVNELSLIESAMWAAQWYFIPEALANRLPLYGYDFVTICANVGQVNEGDFGPVAIVGSWADLSSDPQPDGIASADIGAVFFDDVSAAVEQFASRFNTACESQPQSRNEGAFVATTIPLRQVDPARRFLVTTNPPDLGR